MEAVLSERIAEYRDFLVALFSVRYRERPIVKPEADESVLIARCDEALALLSTRTEKILRLRFGLDDGRRRTQPEIARELNWSVTRQCISFNEKEAMQGLRYRNRVHGLKEFIDYVRRD